MGKLVELSQFKQKIDPLLENYFQKKLIEAGKLDIIAKETVALIRKYTMAGGKRIRPAFLYYGYLAAGGKETEKIIEASMCVELLHSFLLMHDDIIDKDAIRHGVPTIHEEFKKIAENYGIGNDHEHFGNSMAMMTGDMTAAMACEILFTSDFPAESVIRALNKLREIVFVTVPGEMSDVIMQYTGIATEEGVLKMYEGKTARYTFDGPLHLGCLLAGTDEAMLESFSDYALPLGIAFQIQDDIIGIFGDEKKVGKPIGSDIIEGKQTLLVVKALESGNEKQKAAIENYLKKSDLKPEELEIFRKTVRETGSLKYCRDLAAGLVNQALEALKKIEFKNDGARDFLAGIADYMIEREL